MSAPLPPSAPPPRESGEECWRVVGVSGDRSCPELETHIHCRNCPVMAAAARTFFDRIPPEGYLEDWGGLLEETVTAAETQVASVLVFRLGAEWLALPTRALVEVTSRRACHRVPHRTEGILEGIVNIRGQLQLCVSAHRLLGIDAGEGAVPRNPQTLEAGSDRRRLVVVERPGQTGNDRWVFAVDEVAGVQRVERSRLRGVPATVSQSGARFCEAMFDHEAAIVGILDDARFFDGLADRLRTD